MRNAALACALAALAAPPVAAARTARVPDHVTLVYTADVGGYLEPCGCSTDQRGGIARAAAVLAAIRAEGQPVWFVAGGDLLFEAAPAGDARDQEEKKARALAEALRRMRLAAAIEGERDLLLGPGFAKSTRLPFTASARLGPVGFGALGSVPDAPVRVAVVHRGGTRAAQAEASAAARAGIAILLASHRESLLDDDVNRAVLDGPIPVVQVQGRGQSLARVDLFLRGDLSRGFVALPGAAQRDADLDLAEERRAEYARRREAALAAGQGELAAALAGKIDELARRADELRRTPLPEPPRDRPSLRVSFIPLVESLPQDPAVRGIVTRYYAQVARSNLARARAEKRPCPAPAPGVAAYIGTDDVPPNSARACQMCHLDAYAHWRNTPHARAYETLVKVGRQFDLDCIGCHVTGWKEPGGPCSVAATEGRRGVQCESCHGPASLHAADPPMGGVVRDPPEARCRTCHTPENSTHFEFTSYRARVIGPGHGAPAR